MPYSELIFTFFIFSMFGWLIEFIFRSIYEKRLVNPGFNKGPWLPIYGVTGIMIVLVSGNLQSHSIVLRIIFYFLLSSIIELTTGIFLEKAFGKRYWDYTSNRLNIKGFICPLYSTGWVFICLGVEKLLSGMSSFVDSIPPSVLSGADAVLLSVFLVDFIFSSGILKNQLFVCKFYRSYLLD